MRGTPPEILSVPAPSLAYEAEPWSASNHASSGSMPVKVRDLPLSHDEVQLFPLGNEG